MTPYPYPLPSWPGLSRPSTTFLLPKTWKPGTRPGMTKKEVER